MDVFHDVEVEGVSDLPAKAVWDIIAPGTGVDRWFGAITACSVEEDARYCTMIDGSELIETIVDIDHKAMSFRYTVDTHPLPAGRIASRIEVSETTPGHARNVWGSRIEAETEKEAQATADALEQLYNQGIASLVATAKVDGLEKLFADGARARGIDWNAVTQGDLAPIDNFHIGGAQLIDDFFDQLVIRDGVSALDIGAGLGGPARQLARRFASQVTALDANPIMTRLGERLSGKVRMEGQVSHVDGDAKALPLADTSFDLAVSIHVYMFLDEPEAMFAECYRVLKPGGMFGIFSPVSVDGNAIHYPLPWASDRDSDGSLSHARLLSLLAQAGFEVELDYDASKEALDWFDRSGLAISPADRDAPPYGIGIVAGPRFPEMFDNVRRNLADGSIGLRMIRAVRPAG